MKHLAKSTGLEGKFSNHSLSASSATCLFQNGVPEKVIKEITGYLSDCVCEYQHTPNSLKRKVSSTLGKCPDSDIPVKVPKCEEKANMKPELGSEIVNSV